MHSAATLLFGDATVAFRSMLTNTRVSLTPTMLTTQGFVHLYAPNSLWPDLGEGNCKILLRIKPHTGCYAPLAGGILFLHLRMFMS